MLKVSPLLALLILALAAPASAQGPAAAAPSPAPPADAPAVTAAPAPAPPADAPAVTATPAPPSDAPAVSATPSPSAAPVTSAVADMSPVAKRRKLQVGLSLLPMAMGRYTLVTGDQTSTVDMYFAYGFGLSAGYEVVPGLVVGLSPQLIFNVQPKPLEFGTPEVAKQFDLLVRVAYEFRPVETIAVYAELLPGYSRIIFSGDASPASGLVLAFGLGCAADLTDRYFMTLGVGYQVGFQTQPGPVGTDELRTNFVRVALGGGVRF